MSPARYHCATPQRCFAQLISLCEVLFEFCRTSSSCCCCSCHHGHEVVPGRQNGPTLLVRLGCTHTSTLGSSLSDIVRDHTHERLEWNLGSLIVKTQVLVLAVGIVAMSIQTAVAIRRERPLLRDEFP